MTIETVAEIRSEAKKELSIEDCGPEDVQIDSGDGSCVLHVKGQPIAGIRGGQIFFPQKNTASCERLWRLWIDSAKSEHKEEEINEVVYFIQMGGFGPIKIGYASNVDKRLSSLQTGNPEKLRIIKTIPASSKQDESSFHKMFSHLRISGEWFEFSKELKEFLNG